jgi:hypothetical protein
MTYFMIIFQIEHLVKLNKKMTILVKIAKGFHSNVTNNQIEHIIKLGKKKICLIKMINGLAINRLVK